jgi:hypothetical protein
VDERIDHGDWVGELDAYAEEGVPEEVERHPRADEEKEGDLTGPRGGRLRSGRNAQERLGVEQRHEEEQEGERRGEADAEAGPRAAADRRERQRGRRTLHRHRRARTAVAHHWQASVASKTERRGARGGGSEEEERKRTSPRRGRARRVWVKEEMAAEAGVCVAFRVGRLRLARPRRVGETVTG